MLLLTLTEVKVPESGSGRTAPQHMTEPSVRTPQLRFALVLTEVKVPGGGVD